MKKLTEIANAAFFAAVADNIGGDVGAFMIGKTPDYAYYVQLNYKDIVCYDNLSDTVPGTTVSNATWFCNLYGDTINKTFAALTLHYDALSLINTQKTIAFDAVDSNDKTQAATTDSETTSATTFDSNAQRPTGKIEYNYNRTDNTDIIKDHDTTETKTGNDGKFMPQTLIKSEIDFRIENTFMSFLCKLVKECFSCGYYVTDDL